MSTSHAGFPLAARFSVSTGDRTFRPAPARILRHGLRRSNHVTDRVCLSLKLWRQSAAPNSSRPQRLLPQWRGPRERETLGPRPSEAAEGQRPYPGVRPADKRPRQAMGSQLNLDKLEKPRGVEGPVRGGYPWGRVGPVHLSFFRLQIAKLYAGWRKRWERSTYFWYASSSASRRRGDQPATSAMRRPMLSAQSRPWHRLWPIPVRRMSTSWSDTAISSRTAWWSWATISGLDGQSRSVPSGSFLASSSTRP